jgi:hypothetical protein
MNTLKNTVDEFFSEKTMIKYLFLSIITYLLTFTLGLYLVLFSHNGNSFTTDVVITPYILVALASLLIWPPIISKIINFITLFKASKTKNGAIELQNYINELPISGHNNIISFTASIVWMACHIFGLIFSIQIISLLGFADEVITFNGISLPNWLLCNYTSYVPIVAIIHIIFNMMAFVILTHRICKKAEI